MSLFYFINFNISLTLLYQKQLYICIQQTKTNIMKLSARQIEKGMKITVKQNQDCKDFKDVYIDKKLLGCVMANDTMSAYQCYESLKNNWAIDNMEYENDLQLQNN